MTNRDETSEAREENVVADSQGEAVVSETVVPDDSASEAGASSQPTQEVARPALSDQQKIGLLEALLLASGDPLSIGKLQDILVCSKSEVLALADSLQQLCSVEARGIEVVVVAEKLQLRTKAIYADYVRQLVAAKPRRLSQAALETLAVIAYQQPVVKSEIDKIRGVDVAPTIKTLLERNLVKIIGYQASVGQPALYGTTEDFLKVFGLSSLSGLPPLRDLKALVKEPGEALEAGASADSDDVEGPEIEEPIRTDATDNGPEAAVS